MLHSSSHDESVPIVFAGGWLSRSWQGWWKWQREKRQSPVVSKPWFSAWAISLLDRLRSSEGPSRENLAKQDLRPQQQKQHLLLTQRYDTQRSRRNTLTPTERRSGSVDRDSHFKASKNRREKTFKCRGDDKPENPWTRIQHDAQGLRSVRAISLPLPQTDQTSHCDGRVNSKGGDCLQENLGSVPILPDTRWSISKGGQSGSTGGWCDDQNIVIGAVDEWRAHGIDTFEKPDPVEATQCKELWEFAPALT